MLTGGVPHRKRRADGNAAIENSVQRVGAVTELVGDEVIAGRYVQVVITNNIDGYLCSSANSHEQAGNCNRDPLHE